MLDPVFEKMERIIVFDFELFGRKFEVSNTIFVTWIIMAILIALSLLFTRKLSVRSPGKLQRVAELLAETVNNLCKESIGGHWRRFMPYLGTLILYIGMCNIISIFNFIPGLHIYPPTKDINVTGALAAISIAIVIYSGFRYKGFKGWAKSLADPMPLMVPFKLLEYVTKPLSLCLRLFGNVIAAFIIMEMLIALLPIVASPFSAYFDLFDGILQAYIFVYLTSIYIGEAIEVEEHT
ncbi:MAG: F0F1 ATP synthase subunit A [Oscillospiraceae bacterium]|nr:F0F1 ATP synthase subunit A [Oscillospiraceae bacterium]